MMGLYQGCFECGELHGHEPDCSRKGGWRDRCDWCGWPIKASADEGCIADNCSMRPLPAIGEVGLRQQEIRKLEALMLANTAREKALLEIAAPMRDALVQAEACMSIVEPRSDKAEYLRILGVVRSALSETLPKNSE